MKQENFEELCRGPPIKKIPIKSDPPRSGSTIALQLPARLMTKVLKKGSTTKAARSVRKTVKDTGKGNTYQRGKGGRGPLCFSQAKIRGGTQSVPGGFEISVPPSNE